jgi:hypothetical protein
MRYPLKIISLFKHKRNPIMRLTRITALTVTALMAGLLPLGANAADKPMNSAIEQLDLDGDFVLFLNTATIEQRMLEYIDQLSAMVCSTAGADASAPEAQPLKDGMEKVKTAINWSGLFSLESYASSMATVEGTLCRTISVASFAEDDAEKPLWRILASEPKVLQGIQYAPADAVLTLNSTASLDEAWKVANEAVATFLPTEQAAAFNQQIAMVEMMMGAELSKLLGSLENEIFISLQLSEEKQCMLPMGRQSVTIGEPSLLIGLQTQSPLISQLILQKLQQFGAPTLQGQHGAFVLNKLNVPMPMPFPVAPTLVQTDAYLLIGTSPAVITAALDSQAAQNGLISTPLYQKLLAEAPEKTSGIEFLSPRFMQTYMDVMMQTLGSEMGAEGPGMMEIMFGRLANIQSGSYMLKTPSGFYSKGYGDYGGAQVAEMASTAYVGMLSAIAIPSFQKARSNSMEKSCINNLRILEAATEQWAMENGKTNGTPVTEADISPYIKGGIETLKCMKGGTYTIGPVGTAPTCSVHGSL